MTRKLHILSEDAFAAWKGSLETEAVLAACAKFAAMREEISKAQLYDSTDGDAAVLQRMFVAKEGVRLSNEFVADLISLDYDGYRQIVDGGA